MRRRDLCAHRPCFAGSLRTADFVNLRLESEIALKLGADLPASGAPWTRDKVAPAVAGAMPAFELLEDRNADYAHDRSGVADRRELLERRRGRRRAKAGIRRGAGRNTGRLTVGGKAAGEGAAEDPFATLAWLANNFAERGRDLTAGMVVITGSLIPTVSIAAGQRAVFRVEGLGEVVMDAV